MSETRNFYHSFPRPRDGEPHEVRTKRGLAILRAIMQSGLILAPEIVEWHTPVSIGSPSPIKLLQQRICFTELSRSELNEHSRRFGPIAIEFDIVKLRHAGALPVIYMPQALSEQDYFALIGSFVVSHLGHIKHMVELLNSVSQYRDPDHVRKNLGTMQVRDDYVLNLRNVNATGDSVQEFKIPLAFDKGFS